MEISNDSLQFKDALTLASPFIKSLVDVFIVPKLIQLKERTSKTKENVYEPTMQDFSEYLHRTYKRLIVVNTLVFNNKQRLLSEIYQPLSIYLENAPHKKHKIEDFPEKLSRKYGNILITDTAGMGKSTLMKLMFTKLVNSKIGVPIFVELRRLNKSKKILDEIREQLNSLTTAVNTDILMELLSEGGFVIILDGYDEISLLDREVVTADIQDFVTRATQNRFLITSRPEQALKSFGNFQEFGIAPLLKNEAFELLRRYDSQGEISSLLIKKLKEKEMSNIEEFLTNPLLVSLLFTAFEHKQTIPFKKYLFYRQVYDANFENHDLAKGDSYVHDKYCKLEIDDFHQVLRHIGFNCFKLQKIEFTKDELLRIIVEARKFCVGINFRESDFLDDLIKTVPLFTQDGNYYRWSHKSLQEYFAAQFIYLDSKTQQQLILQKMYESKNTENFINLFSLYYDMDYKTFQNVIEFQFLEDFLKYCKKFYRGIFPDVNNEEIIRRKELCYGIDSYLFYTISKDDAHHLDGKEISDALSKLNIKYKSGEYFHMGVIIKPQFIDNFYISQYSTTKLQMLNVFGEKNNKIVREVANRADGRKPQGFEREIPLDSITENKLIKINDSKDEFYNRGNQFSNISDFLEFVRNVPYCVDYNQAMAKHELIKNSIEDESKNNFFLDGF
jgi:hypothetical protein